jgi:hypothetical protein
MMSVIREAVAAHVGFDIPLEEPAVLLTARLLSALSLLILAAHFYRGAEAALAAVSLIAVALLFVRRTWSPAVLQVILALGVVEWLITMVEFVRVRQEMGLPFGRLQLIIGGVAFLCGIAAALLSTRSVRERYASHAGTRSIEGQPGSC